jgi:hypothetical protein
VSEKHDNDETETSASISDRWHSLASTPPAVATRVEDDLEDEDWLRFPTTKASE